MAVWQTVITVMATLSGTALGGVLKGRADSAARVHEWQVSVVGIYGDLMSALSSHYAAMWDLEAARPRGDAAEIAATLPASAATRDAITRPHTQLVVLAPQLCPQIDGAVQAVYAMDTALDQTADTPERLEARRLTAKAAMGALGAGLPGFTSRLTRNPQVRR